MSLENFENIFKGRILALHQAKQWKEILELNPDSNNPIAYKWLWVWPSIDNLEFIACKLQQFRLHGVISVGCGCGLLEWILQQYLGAGIPILGYEVNEAWWKSRYSNPLFIHHHYPELPIKATSLNPDYILMFCYFNDGDAFREYVDAFQGHVLIIIGPGEGRGTHTNPAPFGPKFGQVLYELHSYQEVKNTKDFIATYTRIEKVQDEISESGKYR